MLNSLVASYSDVLVALDRFLAAAILLMCFSILVYIVTHNLFSTVGRAFAALMLFVTVVYVGDVAVQNLSRARYVWFWLRFQWLGIAFVPAACLHLANSLLVTVNGGAPGGRKVVIAGYLCGLCFLGLTLFTDLLVWDGVQLGSVAHLKAGPLFWLFSLYFAATTALGAASIALARQRAATRASRRRLTYLTASFIGPAIGVFPFLVVAGLPGESVLWVVNLLSIAGSTAVMLMLVVMAYSLAYYGVLMPERVVKQSFMEFLLRGPMAGVCVLLVMLAAPERVAVLGLERDAFLVFAVISMLVLVQVAIGLVRPFLDALAYRQDREEVAWLRELERRLLTTTDYRQVLENVLVAACDLVGAQGGFIATVPPGDLGELQPEVAVGAVGGIPQLPEIAAWLVGQCRQGAREVGSIEAAEVWRRADGWLVPLPGRERGATLGVMGLSAPREDIFHEDVLQELGFLRERAVAVMEDMHLQRQVFAVLNRLLPEMDSVRRWQPTRGRSSPLSMAASPVLSPEFPALVRAALRHYWGGSSLRQSPLLQLHVVRQAMRSEEGNPVRALRAVLAQAIEALRPPGERCFTSEWLLYNVLEMKYIQGLRAKEIARRLALSESDFYRKQRAAVEEVARILAEMELRAAAVEGM